MNQLKLTKVTVELYAGSAVTIRHNLIKQIKETEEALEHAKLEESTRELRQISPAMAERKDKAREVLEVGLFFMKAALEQLDPIVATLKAEDL